jgi:hypothetical protein
VGCYPKAANEGEVKSSRITSSPERLGRNHTVDGLICSFLTNADQGCYADDAYNLRFARSIRDFGVSSRATTLIWAGENHDTSRHSTNHYCNT